MQIFTGMVRNFGCHIDPRVDVLFLQPLCVLKYRSAVFSTKTIFHAPSLLHLVTSLLRFSPRFIDLLSYYRYEVAVYPPASR